MVSLVLLTALAAAPVQVTVSRSVDVKAAEADALLLRLRTALSAAGVGDSELLSPAVREGCRAGTDCLREAAGERAGNLLIKVELAWVAGQLGVHLNAVRVQDGEALAAHAFIVDGERYHLTLDSELVRFARTLRAALPDVLPWAPPEAVDLRPAAPVEGPRLVSPERSVAVRRAALGGAATTGVAAGVLAALGWAARAELEGGYVEDLNGIRRSTLDQQRAGALARSANARFTGALVAAALSAALVTTGLLLPAGELQGE